MREVLPPIGEHIQTAIVVLRHLKADLSHILDHPDADRSRDQKVWKQLNTAYVAVEEAERSACLAESILAETLPALRQNLLQR